MQPEYCPVLSEAQNVDELSQNLSKAYRRLRRKMILCSECEHEGNCPALIAFQTEIKQAIAELTEDWVV